MAKETLSFDVWPERVDGPNEERGILEGDWRDPDRIQCLDHLTLYANDLDYQESHSKSAPDWSMGVEARDDQNRTVLTFGDDPPEIVKQCVLEGRILLGVLIGRDEQRHGR
jgi:hypothetical protein